MRILHLLSLLVGLAPAAVAAPAGSELVEVPALPRSPYAALRQVVNVTVGESVSLVQATYEFYYVRAYDAEDGMNPFIVDVPVFVRTEDQDAGRILQMVNARMEIGRHIYRPRAVLLLDHLVLDPVPDVPDGMRVALVSFNIPRQSLKPRFKARLAYDQPHLPWPGGGEWSGYLPMLPDIAQLEQAHKFGPDDFRVTFTALPGIELERQTAPTEIVAESSDNLVVRARHRETIAVVARSLENGG